jgi:hypothetical protein
VLFRVCLFLVGVSLAATSSAEAVARYGIRLDAPRGWHVRIYERPGGLPILHAATVPLAPVNGSDTAPDTQRRLRRGDVLIVLFNYTPPKTHLARWRKNFPVTHPPLAVHSINGPFEGQVAASSVSRNFRMAGRYFQLLVFFGERNPRDVDFARANSALARLHVLAAS